MKQPFKERIGDLMAGKGFYIVLLLCVAAIGISGYYLYTTFQNVAPVSGPVSVTVTPPAVTQTAAPVKPTVPAATVTPRPTKAQPVASAAPTPAPTQQAADFFTWPVKGEVLSAYSGGALVYSETMGDWRTHDGLDIAAETGINVLAAADGTVVDVVNDALLGTVVTIDHGAGLTSSYAGLTETPSVETGDTVGAGQVIGMVGDTAVGESALASHLHFSMAVDGVAVDPMDYLPDQA